MGLPSGGKRLRRTNWLVGRRIRFNNSGDYWENRYRGGGNSGAGSYHRLAQFKAEFLNQFVAVNHIASVIEFGCGDGAQLALAKYPAYVGIDVSETAIASTKDKFSSDESMRFLHTSEVAACERAELALSLDVIYHLVEDVVFDTYMSQLFDAAARFVIVYSGNEDRTWSSPHVRHRRFTRWVEENRRDFELTEQIPNAYPYSDSDSDNTSFADFFVFSRKSSGTGHR